MVRFGRVATASLVCAGLLNGCARPGQDFTLSDLDGKRVALAQYQGRSVLVNFFGVG